MGLVTTWLKGIGLTHAVQSFRNAGINTPGALAKLELGQYEDLGVVDATDRKKLFYLVQRIKMAVDENSGGGDTSTPDHSPSKTRGTLKSPTSTSSILSPRNRNSNGRVGDKNNSLSAVQSPASTIPSPPSEDTDDDTDEHQYQGYSRNQRSSISQPVATSSTEKDLRNRLEQRRMMKRQTNEISESAEDDYHKSKHLSDSDIQEKYNTEDSEYSAEPKIEPTPSTVRRSRRLKDKEQVDNKKSPTGLTLPSRRRAANPATKEASSSRLANLDSSSDIPSSHPEEVKTAANAKSKIGSGLRKYLRANSGRNTDNDVGGGSVASYRSTGTNRSREIQYGKSPPHKLTERKKINYGIDRKLNSAASRRSRSGSYETEEGSVASQKSTRSSKRSNGKSLGSYLNNDGDSVSKANRKPSRTSRKSVGLGLKPAKSDIGEIASRKSVTSPMEYVRPSSTMPIDGTDDDCASVLSAKSSRSYSSRKAENKSGIQRRNGNSANSATKENRKLDNGKTQSNISTTQSSSKLAGSSKSRLQNPSVTTGASRSRLNQPQTKRLSTIPSESALPMSPLQHVSKDARRKMNAVVTDDESAVSLDTQSQSSSRRTRKDISSVRSRSRSASKSPGRRRGREDTQRGGNAGIMTSSSNISTGAVFVHGQPEDDSWETQVETLREETCNRISNLNPCSYDDEEMRIRVVIRKRPMSKKESNSNEVDVIHPLECNGRLFVYQPKVRVDLTKEIDSLRFAFDNVFEEGTNNANIYEKTVRNLIPGVFQGRWGSVFAYGQTGSGKTFTMMGANATGIKAGNKRRKDDRDNFGLYFLAAEDVFEFAQRDEFSHLMVGASLFEIYSGKLFDLLNNRNPVKCLEDHRGKVCFPGLSEHMVQSAEELMKVIEAGALNRSTGTTSANADSSRSHAVLQLSLRKNVGKRRNVEHGRLTFVDLAGSERGADTNKACKSTRLEGAEINTSLLALKEVIRALATGSTMQHIPFRGSKLTQVLKESFIGKNSATVMVACVAPNLNNCEHTINTLRYADRVKERNPDSGDPAHGPLESSRMNNIPKLESSKSDLFRPSTAPSQSEVLDDDESGDNQQNRPATEAMHHSFDYHSTSQKKRDDYVSEKDITLTDGMHESQYDILSDASDDKIDVVSGDLLDDIFNDATDENVEMTLNDSGYLNRRVKEASTSLTSTHRSMVQEMLKMVKHEMKLVNGYDADQDNSDDYLTELEMIQKEHLRMIEKVRESLTRYNKVKGDVDDVNILFDGEDERADSFEDLRD